MATFEDPTNYQGSAAPKQNRAPFWNSATRDMAGGICAGVANASSGYPFDTMKVRLQASHGQYKGMKDVFKHIWKSQGVSAIVLCSPPMLFRYLHGSTR
jgi:hypothetical protein